MSFSKRYISLAVSIALIIFLLSLYCFLFSSPDNFSSGSIVTIEKGMSATDVAEKLSEEHIIRSSGILEILMRISGTSNGVYAGEYLFETPQNVFTIAHRLVTGSYGLPPVRITLAEGLTVRDIASRISTSFPSISITDFLKEGKQYEGYLFPDTYFFPPSADTALVIKTMRDNFDTKISSLSSEISESGHSISDIIIMASLVEKEVRTTENRKIVAGILWDRLDIGMPLQVDAVFGYIFNRDTYSPSLSDLKVDSPYNTYTHKDLPPGPINNPGLDSIKAVLHPTKTNYLYYLTDKNGVMRYAVTFPEHQANQRKYLK